MNSNCAFNLWKGSSQLACEITYFALGGTRREMRHFENETPSGDMIENSFDVMVTMVKRTKYSNDVLLVRVTPMLSNPLQTISAKVNFVHPGRISNDFHFELDDRERLDGTRRNIWCFELLGFEAVPMMDGLVGINVQITVNTDALNTPLSLPVAWNQIPPNSGWDNANCPEEPFDVLIEADGQEFPAHLVVLTASGPVFNKMFHHDTKESLENRIQIDEVTAGEMSNLVQYMYSEYCDYFRSGSMDQLMDLFELADRYLMEDLKDDCVKAMAANQTEDNAIGFLEFGEYFDVTGIKDAVKLFCWSNRRSIYKKGSCVKTLLKRCYPLQQCTSLTWCTFCHMD